MLKFITCLSILTVLFHQVIALCPEGAKEIPSVLGSNWPCVLTNNNWEYDLPHADEVCQLSNGHLISIPNGYVNTFLAGDII